MLRGNTREQQRREALGFWLIVLLICVIAGLLSYQAGRNWVGQRLAEVDLDKQRQTALPTDDGGTETGPGSEQGEPPLQAVVEIEERAPSEGEKAEIKMHELERQVEDSGPQDGAELNAAAADRGVARDEASTRGTGEWVVVAGSFLQVENASNQVERLQAKGYAPTVGQIAKDGVTYHRVNVDSFASREDADKLAQKLRDDDFDATVVHR